MLQSQAVGNGCDFSDWSNNLFIHNAMAVLTDADTLGILARTITMENFRPLAQECIATGMVRYELII